VHWAHEQVARSFPLHVAEHAAAVWPQQLALGQEHVVVPVCRASLSSVVAPFSDGQLPAVQLPWQMLVFLQLPIGDAGHAFPATVQLHVWPCPPRQQ